MMKHLIWLFVVFLVAAGLWMKLREYYGAQLAEAQNTIATNSSQMDDLRSQIVTLNNEKQSLQQDLNQAISEREHALSQLSGLKYDLASANQQVTNLLRELANARNAASAVKQQVAQQPASSPATNMGGGSSQSAQSTVAADPQPTQTDAPSATPSDEISKQIKALQIAAIDYRNQARLAQSVLQAKQDRDRALGFTYHPNESELGNIQDLLAKAAECDKQIAILQIKMTAAN